MLKVWVGLEARKYLQNSAELVSTSIRDHWSKLFSMFTFRRWNCASNMTNFLPTFKENSCTIMFD